MSGSLWRSSSRPGVNRGTGAEQIARAALGQIVDNLVEQCKLVEEDWIPRDQDWAKIIKIPYKRTVIKPVELRSMYLGAQPSLVASEDARFDKWPAITVRVDERRPSAVEEQPDQYNSMDLQLIVEVLAAVGPHDQDPIDNREISDAIDRQYQRLADAVVACIDLDTTLGNNIFPLKLPPTMTPSLPWIRKVNVDGAGGQFAVFQGMEIVWTVTAMMF